MTGQNKEETLRAWMDITINLFREQIFKMDARDTDALYNSFENHLHKHSGGDVAKIQFLYQEWGIYVDMGVGGYDKGNSGDLDVEVRERKEWFSQVYFREVHRLREILQEKFAHESVYSLIGSLDSTFDQRFKYNARSVKYRDQQSTRNMKNYRKRRAFDGKWVNNSKTWKVGK